MFTYIIPSFVLPQPQPVSPTNELGVPGGKPDTPNRDTILKIDDYVFIKQGFQFVKISLADILVL